MVINDLFLELILFESYTNTTFLLINTIHIQFMKFLHDDWRSSFRIDIIWKLDKYNFLLN